MCYDAQFYKFFIVLIFSVLRAYDNIIYNTTDYQRITRAHKPIHPNPALTTTSDKPERATRPVGKKKSHRKENYLIFYR